MLTRAILRLTGCMQLCTCVHPEGWANIQHPSAVLKRSDGAGRTEDAAGALQLPWPLPEPHGIWAAMKLPDPGKVQAHS